MAGRRGPEFLYFARRNTKFVDRLDPVGAMLLLALVGPALTAHTPLAFTGPTDARPSGAYWFGTTSFGQDVFAQFVYGLRATFLVGPSAAGSRRSSGWRSASPPATAAAGSTRS